MIGLGNGDWNYQCITKPCNIFLEHAPVGCILTCCFGCNYFNIQQGGSSFEDSAIFRDIIFSVINQVAGGTEDNGVKGFHLAKFKVLLTVPGSIPIISDQDSGLKSFGT